MKKILFSTILALAATGTMTLTTSCEDQLDIEQKGVMCCAGSVEMHRYETGHKLLEAGVISGFDSTTESAVAKLMFLFGHGLSPEEVKDHMNCSLIGEVTIPDTFRS